MSIRRTSIRDREERRILKEKVYGVLKEKGPCTAHTISRELGGGEGFTTVPPKKVANLLVHLESEGRVAKTGSRNDVYTWAVCE